MASMSDFESEFNLELLDPKKIVRPKEPLYSMLLECPTSTLKYTYEKLIDYQADSQLNDRYREVGLTRREFIEQVQLAMQARQLI